MESGVEQSVVAGYAGQPGSVGAQTTVPVFPQVVCATQRQEDQATHHRADGRHRPFGLGGGWRTFHAGHHPTFGRSTASRAPRRPVHQRPGLTLVREMGLGAARFRSGPEDQQHRHGAGRKAQDHQSGHRCGLGAQDGVVAPEREPGLYLGSQSAMGIHRAGTQ